MVLRQGITLRLLLVLTGLIVFSGCKTTDRSVHIHPIEKSDIFILPIGATVNIPAGTNAVYYNDKGEEVNRLTWEEDSAIMIQKQGRFISDFYLNHVAEVKAEVKK